MAPFALKERDPRAARYAKGLVEGKTKLQSALDAGYSFNQARTAKDSIETRPAVQRALTRIGERAELSAVRTLEELRRIAFHDVRKLFDDQGNLKALHAMTEDEAAGIADFEVIKKNAVAGDGQIDIIHKVKRKDQLKALEILAKHFHLVDETVKVDQDVRITVSWEMPEPAPQLRDVTPESKGITEGDAT